MVVLSNAGEVGDFRDADQFQPAKTQFACGYFACAIAKSMAQVGQPPTLTMQQVIADGEQWYAQYNGNDSITNTDGMTLPQLYSLLAQIKLHFQAIAVDISAVKTWVEAGYPCIIAITEVSVHDMALSSANPYPWNAAGTHVILVTGVTSDGNVLVRDSANCTNLYDPNSLRPGPRKYNASALRLVSATAVVPPWLPRPDNATTPPQTQGDMPMLELTDPMGKYFTATADNRWHCTKTNQDIAFALLTFYQQYGGIFGLPVSGEIYLPQYPGTAIQYYERALAVYDPPDASGKRKIDSPPGAGNCYLLHLDSGMGQSAVAKPLLTALQGQVDTLSKQVADLTNELVAAKQADTSALEAQLVAYKQAVQQVETAISGLK